MERLVPILKTLAAHQVEFVVIGNLGARIQGATVHTRDADIVYHWAKENLKRLLLALADLDAHIRTDRGLLRLPAGEPAVLKASSIMAAYDYSR